ncbi:MAG: flagellar hook-length control protein FliK [Oscillospiraceae bacterium]|nr:flagellar hook-length control protein FliK [Oscillospiraceae bacterium]
MDVMSNSVSAKPKSTPSNLPGINSVNQNSLNFDRNSNIISFLNILQSFGLDRSKFDAGSKILNKPNDLSQNKNVNNNKNADFNDSAVSKLNKFINSKKANGSSDSKAAKKAENTSKNGKSNKTDDIDVESEFKNAVSEILKNNDEDTKVDMAKLLEMLGVPQDIITKLSQSEEEEVVDSAETVSSSELTGAGSIDADTGANLSSNLPSLENMGVEQANKLLDGLANNRIGAVDDLPEEAKKAVSDFYSELQSVYKKAGDTGIVNNSNYNSADNINNLNNTEKTDGYNAYKNALVNYVSGSVGEEDLKNVLSKTLGDDAKYEIVSLAFSDKSEANQNKPNIIDMFNSMKKVSPLNISTNINKNISADMGDTNNINQPANLPAEDFSKNLNGLYKNIDINDDNISGVSKSQLNSSDESIANINSQILSGVTDFRSIVQNNSSGGADTKVNITDAGKEISNLIANNIQKSSDKFQLKMKLFPEEMGELFVKVSYNKGNVSLNIITDNKAAEREIVNQMANLRELLTSRDFNLSNFDVTSRSNLDYNQNNTNDPNNQSNQNYQNASASANGGRNQNGSGRYINVPGVSDNNTNAGAIADDKQQRTVIINYLKSQRLVYKTI